jgi:flavorubredoxin
MTGTLRAREVADSLFWVGGCREMVVDGQAVHNHHSAYLIVGASRTLLVDTSSPGFWPALEGQLAEVLGDRPLDYVVPTHPEVAHAANLPLLLARYPTARLAGDVRDYHLHFPEFAARFEPVDLGSEVDLGGGFAYVILPAPIRDLPSSVWGYERRNRVMFVGDGFGYVHRGAADGELDLPVHSPGECRLLSDELNAPPSVELTEHVTRQALAWSRYVDATELLREVDDLMERYPSEMVAPAHGNVISNPAAVWPVIRSSFDRAFQAEARLGTSPVV